jgi:hypothetical protein
VHIDANRSAGESTARAPTAAHAGAGSRGPNLQRLPFLTRRLARHLLKRRAGAFENQVTVCHGVRTADSAIFAG